MIKGPSSRLHNAVSAAGPKPVVAGRVLSRSLPHPVAPRAVTTASGLGHNPNVTHAFTSAPAIDARDPAAEPAIPSSSFSATQHIASGLRARRSTEGNGSLASMDDYASSSSKPNAKVTFVLNHHADFGQRLLIIGGNPALGAWDVRKAPELVWSEGDNWRAEVNLPVGSVYEYKYVVLEGNGSVRMWQGGNNSVLAVRFSDRELEVRDNWPGAPGAAIIMDGRSGTREMALNTWAQEMDAQLSKGRNDLRRTKLELAIKDQEISRLMTEMGSMKRELELERSARAEAEATSRRMVQETQALSLKLREMESQHSAAFEKARELLDSVPTRARRRRTSPGPAAARPAAPMKAAVHSATPVVRASSALRPGPTKAAVTKAVHPTPAPAPAPAPAPSPAAREPATSSVSTPAAIVTAAAPAPAPAPAQTAVMEARPAEEAMPEDTVVSSLRVPRGFGATASTKRSRRGRR